MNQHEASLELMVIESDIQESDKVELITHLTNEGMPQEIINRLSQLGEKTKRIGNDVYQIGKIILNKVWEFIKANKHLTAGLALGAVLNVLLPFVGGLIAPLASAIGAVLGFRIDNMERGQEVPEDLKGIAYDAVSTAKQFLHMFIEIIESIKAYF